MRFGHFDDERREYVITRPDTPLPWINYLGSEDYFALVSNTAGGYSFFRDARLRRLIRYRYNNAPLDVGGRFLYLRDDDTGDYWNPGWQPTQRGLDDYSCRHGLGYTVITGARGGIRAETTILVPPGETLEVWRTRVTNERSGTARLSVFGAVEFCLWDALDDATNFQRNLSTGEVHVEDGVIYHVTEYRERRDHFAWFASAGPVAGFETSREAFLGPYRGWDRPVAVEAGRMADSVAHGWQPVGALRTTLVLEPGESRDVTFLLGYTENPPDAKYDPPGSRRPDTTRARAVIDRYRGEGRVDEALATLRDTWTERLGTLQVTTGDPHVDRMVNIVEPLPVHGDVQPVALGVDVRVGHRTGHGLPGLQPGPAGLRPHDPGASPRQDPGHRRDPAARRRRVSPIPAAHEARQPRRRLGVQRRPRVARPGRRGLPQGDRRPGDPRRAGAVGQRGGLRDAAPRPPAAVHRLHAATGSARTGCRSSGGRIGTTASTSMSSPTDRASPSRRPRTGPEASPSPCSSPASSCLPRTRPRRSPACAEMRARPPAAGPRRSR